MHRLRGISASEMNVKGATFFTGERNFTAREVEVFEITD
jgi:hypothetical protein